MLPFAAKKVDFITKMQAGTNLAIIFNGEAKLSWNIVRKKAKLGFIKTTC